MNTQSKKNFLEAMGIDYVTMVNEIKLAYGGNTVDAIIDEEGFDGIINSYYHLYLAMEHVKEDNTIVSE
jgi:uncharacterized protein (DUF488 family)